MTRTAFRAEEPDLFRGADAAFERLRTLALDDNAGPVRRVARELTFMAREAIIGIACAELDLHPDDTETEMVKHVVMDVQREEREDCPQCGQDLRGCPHAQHV